ncbi:MAG: hypothetical protein ACOYXR_14920 [Nitrospirota bacterium]
MQHIPLALATEGMVLARDVTRPGVSQGPPICGQGTALTVALIERLARMEVASVVVEGHPVVVEGEPSPDEQVAALDRRFSRVGDDLLMARLKTIFRGRLLRTLGRAESP